MAKFELKFIDFIEEEEFIKVNIIDNGNEELISIKGECCGNIFDIWLDKSTAIKFAKALRTEINKI